MRLSLGKHKFRPPNLAEVLVIGAGLAMLASLYFPDSQTQTRRAIERRIDTWQPGPQDRRLPPASLLRPKADILGEWETQQHRWHSRLVISRGDGGAYHVEFETHGCVGGYEGTRLATFRDGVLALEKAVSEYDGDTYDRLCAVEYQGAAYLLPATAVADYEQAIANKQAFNRVKPTGPVPADR